jgi:hypothetical protein
MSDYLQVLLANLPLILILFLPVSLIMGGMAALYAFLLYRLKNRLVSYAIPFAIIIIWSLWVASQEMPGPTIAIVNYGYMLLFYPMVVVSFLPLANYFLKLEKNWMPAFIVGTLVILVLLTQGGLRGEQVAVIPAIPPTYVDNLVKVLVSLLSIMGYVIAGYFMIIVIAAILNRIQKKPGRAY